MNDKVCESQERLWLVGRELFLLTLFLASLDLIMHIAPSSVWLNVSKSPIPIRRTRWPLLMQVLLEIINHS